MLKAVKECMKNWLATHERLYWYIVVGLAVLAFGIITALGCAKLEKAEAAVRSDFENMLTEQLRYYRNEDKPMYAYLGYEFWEDGAESPYKTLLLIEGYSSTVFFRTQSGSFDIVFGYFPCAAINDNGSVSSVNGDISINDGAGTRTYKMYYLEGNIDFSVYDFPDWVTFDVPASYSPDAPYFSDVTYSNVNLFLIDGNTDFDESTFRFVFDIVGDGREYIKRTAKMSGYVYLPSKEFIDKAVEYYLGGRDTLDAYYSIYSCKEYPNWLKSIDLGDGSTYKKWAIKFDVDCGNNLDLRLSHEQIYQLIEECNGIDLREYYGIDDTAYVDDILKGYMWVHRMDGYIITTYADSAQYGNLTSFVMSTYLNEPVIVVGNSDPLFVGPSVDFVGPMLPDADVQQSINQAYKDALEDAQKEQEELNNSMNGIYDTDGAFGDLQGSDLWTSFRSLADGLAGMAPSVRAIASLSGAVLAFMPIQMTGIMTFTLVSLCIIAIVKAIRG